jgi:hypothetical protein
MKSLLTASRMSTLLACPRKHFWRYEICLQSSTKSDALRFGTAWHNAMEARWRGADYDAALAAALPEGIDLDPVLCATLAGLLAGYCRHHKDEIIKEIHPEIEFSAPLAGSLSFDVAGKIDGLGVLHDGRLVLIEHKTAGEDIGPESDYWLRLRLNQQIMQYVLAARSLGWNVEHVIYDVVRKPGIAPKQIPVLDENGVKVVHDTAGNRVFKKNGEPRESGDTEKGYFLQSREETPEEFSERLIADTNERPDFYFARREVPMLEQDLEEFQVQRLVLGRSILSCRASEKRLARREQAWPRNVGAIQCKNCEYASFCLQNTTIDTNNPPTGFMIGSANPELEQV